MTNPKNGLKLGMNSDYSVFDNIILDPDLTKTVPREQYFYTGLDSYIHCFESLQGQYRNPVVDALACQTIKLCEDIFLDEDMQSSKNRDKLMVASYLGGCSIAGSYVGIVHPLSAALSVVLGFHHCIANCIALNALEEFYPKEHEKLQTMMEKQKVDIPRKISSSLTKQNLDDLYAATIIHEKPLYNALGANFKEILNQDKVLEIISKM